MLASYIRFILLFAIQILYGLDDANQSFGIHLDARTYIGVGVGNENSPGTSGNSIVTRYNLCTDLSQYNSPTANLVATPEAAGTGATVGTSANCATTLGWVKQFGVNDKDSGRRHYITRNIGATHTN